VRTAAVRGEVEPKEVCFIGHIDETGLTPREATAVRLAERIARDPHEVDDDFFAEVRKHFSDEEIVEMVFATSIFNWGNKFNITMRMDAAPDGDYQPGMKY
jgi:alkylhydroperoxidase family enzyme